MDIKSGMLNEEDVFGLKLVSWFGENKNQGLPAISGLTMLFDLKNGFPKAMINASYLTGMRTGGRETPVKTRFKNTNDCRYRSSGDFSNCSHSIPSSDNQQGIYI